MSETAEQPPAGEGAVTAGMLLRRAREAAGIHVATLAVSLKVPVRKLEALEEDRHDQLSDMVFVRALASSVCRTLKIDPKPVLDLLPQGGRPRLLQSGEGINTPFRAPGDGPSPGLADQLTRPVGLAVVALLLGALVIILLPSVQRPDDAAPQKAVTAIEPTKPAASEAFAPVPVPPIDPPVASSSAPAVPPAAGVPAPAAHVAVTAASAPPVAAAAPAPAAAPVTSAPAQPASPQVPGIVSFRARSPSWVQVVDGQGNPVFRRLMEAGETVSATGTLPLTVTVGSARTTEVLVRGKPLDLAPLTRDNVARFEVK